MKSLRTTQLIVYVLGLLGLIALLGLIGLSVLGSTNSDATTILGNVAIGVIGAVAGILSQRGREPRE